MGALCTISEFVESIIRGSSTSCINSNYILYYHIDALRSTVIGHSYFISTNYLVGQVWIRALFLSPTNILLVGPNVH